MQNKFRTIIITYPNKKDLNISILRDDLNNLDTQKGVKSRNLQLEYVREGDKFNIKFIDYDGEVVYTSNKYSEKVLSQLFDIADGKKEKLLNDIAGVNVSASGYEYKYHDMKNKYIELKKLLNVSKV